MQAKLVIFRSFCSSLHPFLSAKGMHPESWRFLVINSENDFLTNWRRCPSSSDPGPILSDSWWEGINQVYKMHLNDSVNLPLRKGVGRCWLGKDWRQTQWGRGGRSLLCFFCSELLLETIIDPSLCTAFQSVPGYKLLPPPPSLKHSLPLSLPVYETARDHIFGFK